MIRRQGGVRAVVALVSGGHFVSHFFILAFPPLFPLLASEFELSNTELGAIVSAIMLPILVLQIPVGELADRIGAKPVFVLGIVVTAVGVVLAGVAHAYWLLIAGALLSGIGQSAFHPADYALLEAVVGESHEGKAYSVHTFGGYAGFAAAPVVVGSIGLSIGWRPALQVAGIAGLGYGLFAHLTMSGDLATRSSASSDPAEDERLIDRLEVVLSPTLVAIAFLYLILFMLITGIQSFTVVFVDRGVGLGPAIGNTALTAFATTSAVGVLAGGPLADRYDIHRTAAIGFLLAGLTTGLLASGLAPPSAVVIVGLLGLLGLVYGLPLPSRDRLVSRYAPPDATGRSFGFVFTGGSIGGFVSPLILGAVIDLWSSTAAFWVLAGLFGLAVGILVGLVVAGTR